MSLSPRSRLAVPVLGLAALLAAGCKGTSRVQQPPQVATAGLRIDVQKADYSQRKMRIDLRVRIWNDHDQRVNFDLGNVRLLFNEREVSPSPNLTKDPKPDVQAKSNRVFEWSFEVGETIGEGAYPIQIRDIARGGAPLGQIAEFRINLGP